MLRWFMIVAFAALVFGCGSSSESAGSLAMPPAESDPDTMVGDDADGAGARQACSIDSDCEAVASSCCECPTFALAVDEGVGAVCEDVECGGPLECPAQEAMCSPQGECLLACSEIVCELSCENGFDVDEAGCAVCSCSTAPAELECEIDDDCVQVAADCCGCSRGGLDTAVAAEQADDFVDGLACMGGESCPDLDTCNPNEAPACVFGTCLLKEMTGSAGPSEVCGTADNPTCASGGDCVLNSRDYPEVAAAGLGVCVLP